MRLSFPISVLGLVALLAGCVSPGPTAGVPRATAAPAPAVAVSPPGRPSLWPDDAPAIRAQSSILIDARTGQVLYEKSADEPRQIASTQKLLTALIVSERMPLDGSVRVEPVDEQVEPTKLNLRVGDVLPRRELLAAMLVKSCNDAAAALARDCAGSTEAFAGEMNAYALALGATNSHFVNPHGLPAPQHSTARDLSRIAFRAYHSPELRQFMCLPSYTFQFPDGHTRSLESTNKLLARSSLFNGMKTGFTNAAGKCLVASASDGTRDLILVQLGSHSSEIFGDAEKMLLWGLRTPRNPLFAATL